MTKKPNRGNFIKTSARAAILALTGLHLLTPCAKADKVSVPAPGLPGEWRVIGTVHAGYAAEKDTIYVQGPFDNFRRIKFKVKDAPLKLYRLVVTYDNGMPDKIEARHNIPKGGESRAIDLRGIGKRSIRKIEFWYKTKGLTQGTADVTVYGMK